MVLSCCSVTILLLGSPSHAAKVEVVTYHGWAGCYRLSNGVADAVFVPQIGRIMRFGYVTGANYLWENEALAGKSRDPKSTSNEWMNFGGDKLWPAPQERWGWPPDVEIDSGGYEVKELPGGKLQVTGKPSKKHGIRFVREICLDPDSPTLLIKNTVVNTSSQPQEWSVWEVCQINRPVWAEIPTSGKKWPGGYFAFKDNAPDGSFIKKRRDGIRITANPKKSAKIGSDSRRGYATANVGGRQFTLSMDKAPGGTYPDSGCVVEIYTNADPDKYVELELLGPVVKLAPGQSYTVTTRMEITHGER